MVTFNLSGDIEIIRIQGKDSRFNNLALRMGALEFKVAVGAVTLVFRLLQDPTNPKPQILNPKILNRKFFATCAQPW